MKRAGVEEEYVTGLQLCPDCLPDQLLILRQLRAQKKFAIKSIGIKMRPMRSGNESQAAILGRLGREGQPNADEIRPLERPVANVLMPSGVARVPRLFRHHAVVM